MWGTTLLFQLTRLSAPSGRLSLALHLDQNVPGVVPIMFRGLSGLILTNESLSNITRINRVDQSQGQKTLRYRHTHTRTLAPFRLDGKYGNPQH